MKHKWSRDDDIIALYLYRFGENEPSESKYALAERLGMGWDSMAMRIANFKSLAGEPGMDHVSNQSRMIYNEFSSMPDDEFRKIGLAAISRVAR